MKNITKSIFITLCFLVGFSSSFSQSPQESSILELSEEINNFINVKSRELSSQGKRIDAEARNKLANEKKNLAKKYSEEAGKRSNIEGKDLYYLGLLYFEAENDTKSLETFKKFISSYPSDVKGDIIQSARTYLIILSARKKQLVEMEQYYLDWVKSEPFFKVQQPNIENIVAVSFFKDGKYEKAIQYGKEAFEIAKTLEAKTYRQKMDKEQIYMNLVEVLALSYKKNKNSEEALSILAEARVESFTLPSANLYRKVMNFVEGSGFSEKKLMQKIESIDSTDAAPDIEILEWVGQEPILLSELRGKVVLLDFWATWCGPCISTFPRLRNWQKKYSDKDFVIVGVTKFYGEGDGKPLTRLQEIDFLNEFKEKHKLQYSFAIAQPNEDSMKYGINAYPTTVLLDRNGVVRYIGIGAGDEESNNLESMIKKLVKE